MRNVALCCGSRDGRTAAICDCVGGTLANATSFVVPQAPTKRGGGHRNGTEAVKDRAAALAWYADARARVAPYSRADLAHFSRHADPGLRAFFGYAIEGD